MTMTSAITRPDGWTIRSYWQTFTATAYPDIADTTALRWEAIDPAGRVQMSGYLTEASLCEQVDRAAAVTYRTRLRIDFDVTGWTDEQIATLAAEASAQGEENADHPDATVATSVACRPVD